MPKLEQRFLDWFQKHLLLIAVVVISFLALIARFPLRDYISPDARACLLPWYDVITEQGLRQQVGNYNLLYQMIIAVMTHIPIKPLYAYKLLSIFFDYVLALGAGLLAYRMTDKSRFHGVMAYCAVLMAPAVILNSAAWAQCDSIYVSILLLSLLALHREKHLVSMLLLGLAFAFKLQAVLVLPLYLYVYFTRRKFSIFLFLLVPATVFLVNLPAVFFGRDLMDTFRVYESQVTDYYFMSANFPTPWLMLVEALNEKMYLAMRTPAIAVALTGLAGLMLYWLRKGFRPEGKNLIYMAFLLSFTCVLLLPRMHDRYTYLYEALAIILAVMLPRTIPLCVGLLSISASTYGIYIFEREYIPMWVLTVILIVAYLGYMYILTKEMKRSLKA